MMDGLISRLAAIDALDHERKVLIEQERFGAEHIVAHHARRLIEDLPAVDAVPVVHGMWDGYKADYSDWQRNDGKPVFISCCVCNNVVLNNASANWNYCPNCGAKMDATGRDKEATPWEK